MLSEKRKQEIKEEEEFRKKIQEDEAKKTPKFWGVLNSSFVIFLLTSVVIGGGTFIYNQVHDNKTKEINKKLAAEKLNAEISARLANGRHYLNEVLQEVDAGLYFVTKGQLYQDLIDTLNHNTRNSSYDDYSRKSLLSLINELDSVTDKKLTDTLKRAIKGYEELNEVATTFPKEKHKMNIYLSDRIPLDIVDKVGDEVADADTTLDHIFLNMWQK
jgi:hypothetical protein